MAVSNLFYVTNPLVAHSPIAGDLQQFRGFESVEHFDGQNLFVQDSRVAQVRARIFIGLLEQNHSPQEKSKSLLQVLLKQALQLPDSEENQQLFAQINQAFFKQRGYFSRLFSGESWEEWTEDRTALGKVASHMRDCVESHAQVDSFAKRLDEEVVRKANSEAEALLKSLNHRDAATGRAFSVDSKSSCATGLVGGTVGLLLTQHPLPLLLGLSGCFPTVNAQQKIGSEFQVNNYTTNDQQFPSVASFPNGNFVVTWESYGQDSNISRGVYGQLINENGIKIGTEFQINTYVIDAQFETAVTSFSNGNFVVTWNSYGQDGDGGGVYGQLFSGNGTKVGNEFQVNTEIINNQGSPSIASLSNEHFIVTWNSLDQDGSSWGVYAQLFDKDGSKIGNEFQINTYTTDGQTQPSIASLQNNSFVVTWQSLQDSDQLGVYGQLFDGDGNKIGNEFRINSYALDNQWRPAVASLINGNFVMTWNSKWQDGDLNGIFGQLFDENGKKIGTEFQVNTEVVNEQLYPNVANLKNDHFIVAWQSDWQDGSRSGIYGQLFDENADKLGNEFQVNTLTTGNQFSPTIASLKNNNFIVTWHSGNQDGSGFGIYGQIFHDNLTFSSSSSSTSSSQTTTTSSPVTSLSVTSDPLSSSSTTRSTSTTNRITTDTIPVTSDSTSKVPLPSSNRNNGLFWLGFLLGGAGWVACLVQTGYFFYKSRRRGEGGDAVELSEKANDPHEDAGDYRYLGDLRRDSHQDEYANRPKRESLGPEYANRPTSAPLGEGYGNVASVEEDE